MTDIATSEGSYRAPFPAAPHHAKVDVKGLLHPTERSRLVLAIVGAAAVVLYLVGLPVSYAMFMPREARVIVVLLLFSTIALVWVAIQVRRAWLLGNAMRVTAESLPEVHSVLDDLRARLDYHDPIDVYVVKWASPEIGLTSYLGSHVILIEGDFIGEVVRDGDRQLLTCLLAQPMGALKARHARFTVIEVLMSSVGGIRVLNFLLLPYLRATRYSGDQIAHACCGSLDSGLAAIERQLIGSILQPGVGKVGVIEQAEAQWGRPAPRLGELLRASPHLTNRYLNLLSYSRDHDPLSWQRFRDRLDEDSRARLDRLIDA